MWVDAFHLDQDGALPLELIAQNGHRGGHHLPSHRQWGTKHRIYTQNSLFSSFLRQHGRVVKAKDSNLDSGIFSLRRHRFESCCCRHDNFLISSYTYIYIHLRKRRLLCYRDSVFVPRPDRFIFKTVCPLDWYPSSRLVKYPTVSERHGPEESE